MNNFSVLKYLSFFAILRFDRDGEKSVRSAPMSTSAVLEQLPLANFFELVQRRFTTVGEHQYTMVQCEFPKDENGAIINFDRMIGFPLGDDLFDDGDDPDDLGSISEFYGPES
jgi:hypothetical protein